MMTLLIELKQEEGGNMRIEAKRQENEPTTLEKGFAGVFAEAISATLAVLRAAAPKPPPADLVEEAVTDAVKGFIPKILNPEKN